MRWPFAPERRTADTDDNDQVYGTPFNFLPSLTFSDLGPTQSSIHIAAASTYANAMASAEFMARPELAGLTAEVLANIAMQAVLYGQSIHYIDAGFALVSPTTAHVESGDHRPSSWRYRLALGGPDRTTDLLAQADDVLHIVWRRDPHRPWLGVSPFASEGARAALSFESSLLADSRSPTVSYLPVPQSAPAGPGESYADAPADSAKVLQKFYSPILDALRRTKGGLLFGSSFKGVGRADDGPWSSPTAAGDPQSDEPQRWGPQPNREQRLAFSDMARASLSAALIPPELFTEADGATRRESYRVFYCLGLLPFAKRIAAEVSQKLAPVEFRFSELAAVDLQQRSRAFRQFVDSGMSQDAALSLVGLQQGQV